MKEKYFYENVDLEYIKEFQMISEGHIEKFTNINTGIPSVRFIAYRKIIDKDSIKEYNTEIAYTFKFQGYHWLIDTVSYKPL
jgi:hypothetical protein